MAAHGGPPGAEFAAFLHEQLAPLGTVRSKRMFGGWGVFLDGLMFALIADEQLYLKTDDGNRQRFETAGLPPFTYRKGEKDVVMSYHLAPEESLEDPELLREWARESAAAALRSRR